MSVRRPMRGMGFVGMIGLLIGAALLLVALLGVANTAFELEWAIRISGASTDLPSSYEECLGVAAAGFIFIVLSLFGSVVAKKFKAAKGRPLVRIWILLVAAGLLVLAGRGAQIVALKSTYGSMLAYYCTDGDLEDVKKELAKGPSKEALDRSVSRAAQYDNVEALKLLLAAGADFKASTSEHPHCALGHVGPAFVEVALAHGVTPDTCPDSGDLIWTVVDGGREDAEIARIITGLKKAGWSVLVHPDFSEETPAQIAERRGLTATLAVLGGGSSASP